MVGREVFIFFFDSEDIIKHIPTVLIVVCSGIIHKHHIGTQKTQVFGQLIQTSTSFAIVK